jgi:hypothetical protein
MAQAIADVHREKAELIASVDYAPVDLAGKMSASLMETLGDVLNGMDAVSEEDEWLTPVFKEAQRRWPSPRRLLPQ